MNSILAEPLTGHDLTGMLTIGLTFLGLMLGLGGSAWFTYRKQRLDAELKHAMIARGYTAAEIVAVLAAPTSNTSASPANLPDVPPAKPIKQAGYGV